VAGFYGIKEAITSFATRYSEAQPLKLPQYPPRSSTILQDWQAFLAALEKDEVVPPFVLDSASLNELVHQGLGSLERERGGAATDWRNNLAFAIEDDQIKVYLSVPLDSVGAPGQFFNLTVKTRVKLFQDQIALLLSEVTVKGIPVPPEQLSGNSKIAPLDDSPLHGRLDNVEVRNGKLTLTPKPPGKRSRSVKMGVGLVERTE
jgi:hypothetical protein